MDRMFEVARILVLCIAFASLCSLDGWGQTDACDFDTAIPWGAMYTPNEHLTAKGMTGAVKYYRGDRGAGLLLTDLAFAKEHGVRLILTLGSVAPANYLDAQDHIDFAAVDAELSPFFELADQIRPYIDSGTIWGIRFMDEPHDPSGYPVEFDVDPIELGEVFARIREAFGDVRVGSTAPPWYMMGVPNAGLAFGQVVHQKLPPGFSNPINFHINQSELAHQNGLLYVASLNANTNTIDNVAFFETYRAMCAIPTVDFATCWQWPQGHHPLPSFEARFNDPDPAVQIEIQGIPEACQR